jgi:hypothetical protein
MERRTEPQLTMCPNRSPLVPSRSRRAVAPDLALISVSFRLGGMTHGYGSPNDGISGSAQAVPQARIPGRPPSTTNAECPGRKRSGLVAISFPSWMFSFLTSRSLLAVVACDWATPMNEIVNTTDKRIRRIAVALPSRRAIRTIHPVRTPIAHCRAYRHSADNRN